MTKNNQGFTLIEVLIALIILAVALTAAVLAIQSSIRGISHVEEKLAAHWVAMNVISSMQVGLLPSPHDSQQEGESKMLQKTFSWVANLDQASTSYYERIYVDVSLKDSGIRLEHLVGFLSVPQNNETNASLPGTKP